MSHAWGDPRIDGVASVVIGAILAAVAALLAREAKGLPIGERADPALVERARAGRGEPRHHRGQPCPHDPDRPDAVFVAISADFDDRLTMGEGEALIEESRRDCVESSGKSPRSTSARRSGRTR